MFIISVSRLYYRYKIIYIDFTKNYFTIVACSYICISVKKHPLVYGYIFSIFLSKIDVTFIFLEDKKKLFQEFWIKFYIFSEGIFQVINTISGAISEVGQ